MWHSDATGKIMEQQSRGCWFDPRQFWCHTTIPGMLYKHVIALFTEQYELVSGKGDVALKLGR